MMYKTIGIKRSRDGVFNRDKSTFSLIQAVQDVYRHIDSPSTGPNDMNHESFIRLNNSIDELIRAKQTNSYAFGKLGIQKIKYCLEMNRSDLALDHLILCWSKPMSISNKKIKEDMLNQVIGNINQLRRPSARIQWLNKYLSEVSIGSIEIRATLIKARALEYCILKAWSKVQADYACLVDMLRSRPSSKLVKHCIESVNERLPNEHNEIRQAANILLELKGWKAESASGCTITV